MENEATQRAESPQIEMLTVTQCAKRGILPERTLRQLVKEKRIPTIEIGSRHYVNYKLLIDMLTDPRSAVWK
jgi:hypothetical protein